MDQINAHRVADFFKNAALKIASLRVTDIDESAVDHFFSQAAFKLRISESTRKELDRYLATRLNIVRDYVRPDENQLSLIFSDILSPDGSHGQGSLFLKAFLTQLGATEMVADAEFVAVREQYTDTGRRIDLLLKFAEGKAIGVENKPFADDQEHQIRDYSDYLQRNFPDKYILFYLTPFGNSPPEHSISKDRRMELEAAKRLRYISYRGEITTWLETCSKECKAEKVRWLLRDLTDFINEQFRDEEKE